MSIALVTDSTADLPPELARELGITVIPLEIRLGGRSYLDGVDLGTPALFTHYEEERAMPLTSQPPLGAFAEAYRKLLARHNAVISVHIGGAFSGTYDTALLARQSLPDADITVLDSGSFTLGLGLQVLQTARLLKRSACKEEALAYLAKARAETQVLGVLDDLNFLRLGGRISRVAHLFGSLLQIKPVIRVAGNQGQTLRRCRRRAQAKTDLQARLAAGPGDGGACLGVIHTMAGPEAEALRAYVEKTLGPVEMLVEAGPVVACHVGPRALGVALVPNLSAF